MGGEQGLGSEVEGGERRDGGRRLRAWRVPRALPGTLRDVKGLKTAVAPPRAAGHCGMRPRHSRGQDA